MKLNKFSASKMDDNITAAFIKKATRIEEYKQVFSKVIVESIPGSFSINDANGRLVWWNAYHRDEILGKPEDEMLFINAIEVFHPDDKVYALEAMLNILNLGIEVTSEGRVLLRGGPKFQWKMITGRRIIIDGNPFVIAIGMDITERKRFEAISAFRLRMLNMVESHSVEELLRATLDEAELQTESTIGLCHFVADDQTAPSLSVLSTSMQVKMQKSESNLSCLRLYEDEMCGVLRDHGSIVYNNCSSSTNRKDMSESNSDMKRSICIPLLGGARITAILCVGDKQYDYDEGDLKIVSDLANLAWDMIARKHVKQSEQKMQEVFLQAQKMELVGQLAGGIAHDFNNLLGIILGNVKMAISVQGINESVQKNLKVILKAAEHSAGLTRQLLAFSQTQSVMPIILELNTMVEKMLPVLRRMMGKNISLEWIPEPYRTSIKIDPAQIDLILGNLCVNSCDAITGFGNIIIKTDRVHVDKAECIDGHPCKKPGDYVTLAVTDNGCGIEKKDFPHIFEPFFTTKGVGNGTGMGLSTIYGIVKQNNASIECRSERGKGTAMKIYFPRHTAYEGTEKSNKTYPSTIHRNKTILLVGDEPDILNISKFMLENNGYTVLNATKPSDALHIAGEHKGLINLLLTDVVLPEMNGCDLSKKIQSMNPNLYTLFMSSYTADFIPGHGLLNQSINFIQKPFTISTLLLSLQKIFESQ